MTWTQYLTVALLFVCAISCCMSAHYAIKADKHLREATKNANEALRLLEAQSRASSTARVEFALAEARKGDGPALRKTQEAMAKQARRQIEAAGRRNL